MNPKWKRSGTIGHQGYLRGINFVGGVVMKWALRFGVGTAVKRNLAWGSTEAPK